MSLFFTPSTFHAICTSSLFRRTRKNKEMIMLAEYRIIDSALEIYGTNLATYQADLVRGRKLHIGTVNRHQDYEVKKKMDRELEENLFSVYKRVVDFHDEYLKEPESGDLGRLLLYFISQDENLKKKNLKLLSNGGEYVPAKELLEREEVSIYDLLFGLSYYLFTDPDIDNTKAVPFLKIMNDKMEFDLLMEDIRNQFSSVKISSSYPRMSMMKMEQAQAG